jgi:hypothetical protein
MAVGVSGCLPLSFQTQHRIGHDPLLLFVTICFVSIADYSKSVLDKYFDPVVSLMPIISGFVDETLTHGSQLSPFDE